MGSLRKICPSVLSIKPPRTIFSPSLTCTRDESCLVERFGGDSRAVVWFSIDISLVLVIDGLIFKMILSFFTLGVTSSKIPAKTEGKA